MIEDNGHVVFILGCLRCYGMAFMSGTIESELVESTYLVQWGLTLSDVDKGLIADFEPDTEDHVHTYLSV